MKQLPLSLTLIAGCLLPITLRAADDIALTQQQLKTLNIETAALPAQQQGELSGMPAQVVIPGNQLFVISAPFPAMVEQTIAGVGDTVKKGQVLARLQSPALAETQRGLIQAASQAKLSKENLTRDEQLWKDGIISESRYRTTQSQSAEANAALLERRQTLRMAGVSEAHINQLQSGNGLNGLLAVTAPIDGVVLEKSIQAGQRLDAAAALFKVAKLDPLALEIQVPLKSAQGLTTGARVTIPAFSAEGKLTAVGRSLSGGNQTIMLRATITKGAENLRPGQFVEASVAVASSGKMQWNVPNSALARLDGKSYIFVATPKGFHAEPVTILNEGAQSTAISGNLKGDEKIAVRGTSSLKASMMGIGGGE
jgi:RND family efflux transporter MFP subunit